MLVLDEHLNTDLKNKTDDYKIFMAVSENSGKDNSGDEIYEVDKNGEKKLDEHGHLKQKHDLDDIAFAFEKWGRRRGWCFGEVKN